MDPLGLPPATGIGPDGMVQFRQSSSHVTFYSRAEHNPQRSEIEGRPVYDAVDFVKVFHPGERDVVDRAVTDIDKYRWPEQWARYKQRQEQAPDGTPLAYLFPQNPDIVAQLRHHRFHTVEQLAAATDVAIQAIGMGGRQWSEKARKFLDGANKAVGFHALQGELEQRDARIAQLEDVIAKQGSMIAKLQAAMTSEDAKKK